MRSLDEFACGKLAALERARLRRTPVVTARDGIFAERGGRRLLSFSCNDYLNLSRHPAIIKAAVEAAQRYGVGAGASRLVTGNHPLYDELESRLARLKGTEAACVFGSGYLANIGIIPALAGSGDLILVDELSHACIHAGAKLSGATVQRYRHGDVAHAEALLAEHRGRHAHALIATDGVFSMDGDLAPLEELSALAKRHDAWLLVDDAHGLGVVGHGRGSVFANGGADVPLQMGTLSKAVGAYGGYLCASQAGDRPDAHPRPDLHLFDRPAAAGRRRRHRRPRSDRARSGLDGRAVAQGAAVYPRAQSAGGAKRHRAGDRRRGGSGARGVGNAGRRRLPGGGHPAADRTRRHGAAALCFHGAASGRRDRAPCGNRANARYWAPFVSAIFITATGTDVGKTYVAASLIRHLRQLGHSVDAIKPIVSGFDPAQAATSDPGILLEALGLPVTADEIERTSPWRFRDPVSPDLAAAREGRRIDVDQVVAFCQDAIAQRRDVLLIEGVGGIMVPLDGERTILDVMMALRLPLILVTGSYLGTISHTLTALDALYRRDMNLLAIIVSETPGSPVPLDDVVATISRFAEPVIGLPRRPARGENSGADPGFGRIFDPNVGQAPRRDGQGPPARRPRPPGPGR